MAIMKNVLKCQFWTRLWLCFLTARATTTSVLGRLNTIPKLRLWFLSKDACGLKRGCPGVMCPVLHLERVYCFAKIGVQTYDQLALTWLALCFQSVAIVSNLLAITFVAAFRSFQADWHVTSRRGQIIAKLWQSVCGWVADGTHSTLCESSLQIRFVVYLLAFGILTCRNAFEEVVFEEIGLYPSSKMLEL
jgi:hypothetical protein